MALEHITTASPSSRAPARENTARKRLPSSRWRKGALAWAFMLPFFLVNGLVVLGPSIATVFYSFTDWSGVGEAQFVGLANFLRLLEDAEFLQAMVFNLIWMAMFLTVPIAMGLFGAFLLSQIRRFQIFFRAAYFVPYIIASVVTASIWEQILDPQQGLAYTLSQYGIHFLDEVYFFGDQNLALGSVAFVDNWHFWGFLVVLFLAAMQAVSNDLYDAARVDGAGRWRQFYHVTLPGIRPVLGLVMLLVMVWSLLVFEYPYIITQGGPAGATQVMTILLYKNAFSLNEAGYAAAMGLSLSIVAAIISVGYLYLRRKGVEI